MNGENALVQSADVQAAPGLLIMVYLHRTRGLDRSRRFLCDLAVIVAKGEIVESTMH